MVLVDLIYQLCCDSLCYTSIAQSDLCANGILGTNQSNRWCTQAYGAIASTTLIDLWCLRGYRIDACSCACMCMRPSSIVKGPSYMRKHLASLSGRFATSGQSTCSNLRGHASWSLGRPWIRWKASCSVLGADGEGIWCCSGISQRGRGEKVYSTPLPRFI